MCRTLEQMHHIFTDTLAVILQKERANAEEALLFLGGMKETHKEHVEEIYKQTDELEANELKIGDEFAEMYGNSSTVIAKSPFFERVKTVANIQIESQIIRV